MAVGFENEVVGEVVLDAEPLVVTAPQKSKLDADLSQKLKEETAIVQFGQNRFGVRRSLSRSQAEKAAEPFGADGDFLSARKKLIDTSHDAYRAVTNVLSRAEAYWRAVTVPYPEYGRRLIRQSRLDEFKAAMDKFQEELDEAKELLRQHYDSMIDEARVQLGTLWNDDDYPKDITCRFAFAWEICNGEPPEYLKVLNPDLYEMQKARIAAKFEEALALTEQGMADELNELVHSLADKMTNSEDGKPKKISDKSVGKFLEFFERFKEFNVGSNAELDKLVEQAKSLVLGVTPNELRKNIDKRAVLKEGLDGIKEQLSAVLVDRPRRAIRLTDDFEDSQDAARAASEAMAKKLEKLE